MDLFDLLITKISYLDLPETQLKLSAISCYAWFFRFQISKSDFLLLITCFYCNATLINNRTSLLLVLPFLLYKFTKLNNQPYCKTLPKIICIISTLLWVMGAKNS